MNQTLIDRAAEDAIRRAEGDWESARSLFQDQLESESSLKQALIDESVSRVLRLAAVRLGASTIPCESCGEEIALDAQECRFCGQKIHDEAYSTVPQAPPKAAASAPIIRHFTLLTGWILIVLIVILIVSFAT